MSKISKIVGALFGGSAKAPEINIPAAVIPAAPAPMKRTDTGASVTIGTDAVKNQRVSGGGSTKPKKVDVLSGLGAGGGLSI